MKKPNTFIIAEAGVNHNGDLELAKMLVMAAKDAGADAIKFQTFKADRLVTGAAAKADYQQKTTKSKESQLKMLKRLELGEDEQKELMQYCKRKNMEFISSPFDEECADFLEAMGVKTFKIPSGEITNIPYLKHIAKKNKPIILSTGMSTLAEVKKAVKAIQQTGNKKLTLLHCVTEYPTPFEEVNLKAMQTLQKACALSVGYSDHTPGIDISVAAVALGATVIEKHLTLDKKFAGPDHKASLEPKEFQALVQAIRNVELALGDGKKQPSKSELKNKAIVRKSVVAAGVINKGQTIAKDDLIIKRPGYGVQPADATKLVGRIALQDIDKDTVIEWAHVK